MSAGPPQWNTMTACSRASPSVLTTVSRHQTVRLSEIVWLVWLRWGTTRCTPRAARTATPPSCSSTSSRCCTSTTSRWALPSDVGCGLRRTCSSWRCPLLYSAVHAPARVWHEAYLHDSTGLYVHRRTSAATTTTWSTCACRSSSMMWTTSSAELDRRYRTLAMLTKFLRHLLASLQYGAHKMRYYTIPQLSGAICLPRLCIRCVRLHIGRLCGTAKSVMLRSRCGQ
jgi:hypothetical protein